ncbi:Histidine-specific methyltransferase EgtD [Roseimaritima multifibrata]|uniref:Histidine-specific methyltransferase EgtD n=1 Tax=Roseimaritima multifibrata TaxID=1930274 RepID=A0A517MN52_9BACT|nr:L-histidine N(alpha)-methyltransferase [Roseimaritima multifibrata]QDS96313.1 Histidine-specific methyltransferase EgtD [Roseimaritima multifibrata]
MNRQLATDAVRDIFRLDVLSGLSKKNKSLPCKYLYDERGSQLFDRICETDEYYPTRTELQIMEENADSIANQIGERVMLVEYGSGSSIKTVKLLESLRDPAAYVPVDISEEHLLRTAENLRSAFPDIAVLPVVADFTQPFELPKTGCDFSHIALYFPGSTIGNFTPAAAGELLEFMSSMLGDHGGLLIGIDLQKSPAVIEAAYNDALGVTSEFSLNLLKRINSELDGNFDLDQFKHKAVYQSNEHRIKVSIVSGRAQTVMIAGQEFDFEEGEEILTEYSHKYTIDGFADFAAQYGFSLHKHWTDPRQYFGLLHLVLDAPLP